MLVGLGVLVARKCFKWPNLENLENLDFLEGRGEISKNLDTPHKVKINYQPCILQLCPQPPDFGAEWPMDRAACRLATWGHVHELGPPKALISGPGHFLLIPTILEEIWKNRFF